MSANGKIPSPPWSDRRARAAEMLASGMGIACVATELGLSRTTARRYHQVFMEGGPEALLRLGDVGRRQQLPSDGIDRLISAIRQVPKLQGLAEDCWTTELVRSFIQREFGVCYSYSHVNRLLRDHGLQPLMQQVRVPISNALAGEG
ncbi:helix-turn-helix domain-containing protein [Paraburkholderia sp. J8-2]|uniref:helix-turn-helix domain-containing protein n=1 Tax=Paraburkholderia sp. J8-2 TaxID=2805440 RepID=UPI002AB7520D|nr:winged helix-turn-helix domain-containing protein [Paraburkholderia sp. J8-2]